eukprot:scaffold119020_cov23-Cyclotella_meneghiniana.AAC.1
MRQGTPLDLARAISYQGELRDGKKHGFGTELYSNGASYEGNWKEGKRHGRGLYKFSRGGFYDGEWFEGKKHGRGLNQHANGDSYDGEWYEHEKHGRGRERKVNGDSYNGEWRDGRRHGRGLCHHANGNVYNGEWREGKKHGSGQQKYADGGSYDGKWLNNKHHGKGLYRYTGGDSYDGEWLDNKRHGKGIYKYSNGDSYDGTYLKSERHGKGIYRYVGGASYVEEWLEGELLDGVRVTFRDNVGLKRSMTLPTHNKISKIFDTYEKHYGKSLCCRLKHNERYIFYSQSKNKTLEDFGIRGNDVITMETPLQANFSNNLIKTLENFGICSTMEVPLQTNTSNNLMTKPTATSSTEKPKRSETQTSQQRRPWAGCPIDTDSHRLKHSNKMNLVLKEIQPQLEKIRRHLNDLSLKRTQPKDKTTTSKQAPANIEQVEFRPDSVGIGSKAGIGSFVINVGEANNLYKTSKHHKLIRSNPSICLDLHKLTKEHALSALNQSLPTWVEKANNGVYPFVIQVRIVCGKGSQTLSGAVIQWIHGHQQVAHAPRQKQ